MGAKPGTSQNEADDSNEYIIPPGAVKAGGKPPANAKADDEQVDADEELDDSVEPDANLEAEADATNEASDTVTPEADGKVAIDGSEYTKEELEEIFSTGKGIAEYKKAHPGWDPFLLERDYRIKTARLAELEKAGAATVPAAEAEKKAEQVDLSDVHPDDVTRIQKILKAGGYVSRAELDDREQKMFTASYDQVKNQVVNDFIAKHPEYHPKNDVGDTRWNTLLGEYNLFNLPKDPRQINDLLERAHRLVSGKTLVPKDAAKILAQSKVNADSKSFGGGSGGAAIPSSRKSGGIPKDARNYLKGFSEEELSEMFSTK